MSRPTQPPLVKQLRDQHDVIESVVGSLYHWAMAGQETEPRAREIFLGFFRTWVNGFHHELEENLFEALADKAEIPADRGPLMILRQEHEAATAVLDRLLIGEPGQATQVVVIELAHILWTHIDKENSVMLPEAGERLVRNGAGDLQGREPTAEEDRVRRQALACVERWTPRDDDDLYRGDGCMVCEAYGDSCGGIEKEWWNSWEWDFHNSYQG